MLWIDSQIPNVVNKFLKPQCCSRMFTSQPHTATECVVHYLSQRHCPIPLSFRFQKCRRSGDGGLVFDALIFFRDYSEAQWHELRCILRNLVRRTLTASFPHSITNCFVTLRRLLMHSWVPLLLFYNVDEPYTIAACRFFLHFRKG